MRPGKNAPSSMHLKRQVEDNLLTKQQIIDQAKQVDSQGQEVQFFYNTSVQKATAVTKALKARFTYSTGTIHDRLETNLITFCSNILKVYTLGESSVNLRVTTQFNDKILDIVRVPTEIFAKMKSKVSRSNSPGKQSAAAAASEKVSAREQRSKNRRGSSGKETEEKMIDTTGQPEEVKDEKMVEDQQPEVQEPEEYPDYLFLITQSFNVALLCYSRDTGDIEVVSRGNIAEKVVHEKKEPPYSIFLGQTGTFVALMLYQNLIKVVPLVRSSYPEFLCSLTHATAVRLRHSNVLSVVPLLNSESTMPSFGVFYQRTEHVRNTQTGMPCVQVRLMLERYNYDRDKSDLTPASPHPIATKSNSTGLLDFQSSTVYKIEPLIFGGYLAFDIDSVSYCRMELGPNGVFQQQLKSNNQVTAICQVDDYELAKSTGLKMIRYLFATESGELYMLAFNLQALEAILAAKNGGPAVSSKLIDKLMVIEFLASKLTFCSSLVYLDNSYIFYSSKEGDSFVLKITPEHQGSKEQPYILIEQRFQSLAPIMDLQLARPELTHGQQSELIVVAGWNHQTHLNLVKQGVGLKSIHSFENVIPKDWVQQYFTIGEKVYLRVFGYEVLIGLASVLEAGMLKVDGFDVSRNMEVKPAEEWLALAEIEVPAAVVEKQAEMQVDEESKVEEKATAQPEVVKKVVLLATSNHIKLVSVEGPQLGSEVYETIFAPSETQRFTFVKTMGTRVIAVCQGGLLIVYEMTHERKLTVLHQVTLEAEVSAISLASHALTGVNLAYIGLMDAPYYNLCLVNLDGLGLVAKWPLHAFIELTQMKQYQEHRLVRKVDVFEQFSASPTVNSPTDQKGPSMLQDLPKTDGSQPAATSETPAAEVVQSPQQQQPAPVEPELPKPKELCMQLNCSAARSLEHLIIDEGHVDHVIIGFGNGKLMTVNVDTKQVAQIIKDPENHPPFLQFTKMPGSEDDSMDEDGECQGSPLWGTQVAYVGTIHPKLSKITTNLGEAVIACCDRPVVFYENLDGIEMHYLAFNHIRNVESLSLDSKSHLILYEDSQGVIHLSENDSLRKLQIHRMMFKMQITKTLLTPENDTIVVLLEQPNLDYIDGSKAACNVVGLISRCSFKVQNVYQLQKSEIANCAIHVKSGSREYIFVGTTYLRPEEQTPTMGRLILLDAKSFDFIFEFPVQGSIQSMLVTKCMNYLILGINNMVDVYNFKALLPHFKNDQMTMRGKLDMLDRKVSGTFIQSIIEMPEVPKTSKLYSSITTPTTLVVGDMAGRGVSTFELRESRIHRVKIVEAASTHISMWVNAIVPLSESQFIVFDQEGNMFVFQKNLAPTCIEEKLKLTLKGSYCVGEEVQSAAFGNLRTMNTATSGPISAEAVPDKPDTKAQKLRQKRKAYLQSQARPAIQTENAQKSEADEQMMVTRSSRQTPVAQEQLLKEINDPSQYHRLITDSVFAKRFAEVTLQELLAVQELRTSIVYGTSDGSIGQLFSIQPKVYILLQLLQNEMDNLTNLDLVQQKRSDYRKVKSTHSTCHELAKGASILNGIIDGDFIEQFLTLPHNKQLELTKGLADSVAKGDDEFTDLLRQIVILLRKCH